MVEIKNKIKKYKDKKVILAVLSILVMLIIIVISSFMPLLLDPSKFLTLEFLTNSMITIVICIFGTISCMIIGQASNETNEKSKIYIAREQFFEKKKQVGNFNFFYQWVKKVLQPNDLKEMQLKSMQEKGITMYKKYSYLDLTETEIKSLLGKPQKINGNFYASLNQEQVELLLKIKSGKFKNFHFVEPIYYLTLDNRDIDKTISERSGKEGSKKTFLLSLSLISKIILTLLVSMVFASLMPKDGATTNVGNQFFTLFSRLSTLFTSAFMGYNVGCQTNDIDASFLDLKSLVIDMYLSDTTFSPLDEEELAKEEFKEQVKKDNEEYMKQLENNSSKLEMKGE